MLRSKIFQSKWLAYSWLIFISILFCIPGSSFPRKTWFSELQLDKWAHVGLFAILLFLFCSVFGNRKRIPVLLITATLYGLAVEIVQGKWIPRRDFDGMDLVADIAGAMMGVAVWLIVYKKNKPL